MRQHPSLEYYRPGGPGKPHVWCEGCGIGLIWTYTIKAIEKAKLDPNQVVWIGGSGCTGRMCSYWEYDLMHTLHGRPLGFATGVKVANPDVKVICHMGDGETSAIGGNHLIQTARRNVDLLAVCVNNLNYGMTGGQFSPTTPHGAITQTSRLGNIERPFDLCDLVETCGGTYVARWTVAHPQQCINSLYKGLVKPGFSFVEIISQCPTHYGKANKLGSGLQMMRWLKDNSIRVDKAKGLTADELEGKFVIGEFVDIDRPDYGSSLREIIRLRGGAQDV